MTAVQLDLFTPVDERQDERESWAARFERAWFTTYDWDTRRPVEGEGCLGYRCPCCGDVEPNAAVLSINHGYDPDRPGAGYEPFGRTCVAQMLRRAHAAYDAKHGAAT